ncbi:structural protein [Flavobacterium phage vB_FspP_elemoC_13-1C]|nr:structural protein [Flavobacterium phage vB_FspP_elemoC_13-1C]
MAAATSIAMAGVGLLGSGYQAIKGAKDASDAKNALNNYPRQEFNNIAEGMQVSTLGANLQREEQARLAATQVGALQGAGVRGVIGGLGRVEAGNQMVNRQIGAELDMQQKQIDQMYAQDEANIRGMQEQREMQDISGLSSQYNAGNQMMWQGIGGVAQAGISGLGALEKSNTPTTSGNYYANKFNNMGNNIPSGINYTPTTPLFQ